MREPSGFQQSRKSAERARSHPRAPGRRDQQRPGRSVARAGGSHARGCGDPARGEPALLVARCHPRSARLLGAPAPSPPWSRPGPSVRRGEMRRSLPRQEGGTPAGLRGAALSAGPGKLSALYSYWGAGECGRGRSLAGHPFRKPASRKVWVLY